MLVVDAMDAVAVISFDAEDGGRALLGGLAAVEHVSRHHAWLARSCTHLPEGTRLTDPRVLVFAPTVPPGVSHLLAGNDRLALHTIKAVRANGELGLLVEPWQTAPANGRASSGFRPVFRTGESVLSEDEARFFE